jgi:hypothetical protein
MQTVFTSIWSRKVSWHVQFHSPQCSLSYNREWIRKQVQLSFQHLGLSPTRWKGQKKPVNTHVSRRKASPVLPTSSTSPSFVRVRLGPAKLSSLSRCMYLDLSINHSRTWTTTNSNNPAGMVSTPKPGSLAGHVLQAIQHNPRSLQKPSEPL